MEVNKKREYAPARSLERNKGILVKRDVNRIDENKEISAIKFRDGGAAILAIESRNHSRDINGNIACIPLVKNKLRVCEDSYIEFAIANKPDELRPCAIIMIRAASYPQDELDITPAVIRPI